MDNRAMWWANSAGLNFWKAESVEDLRLRDFKDDSLAVVERLHGLAAALVPGETSQESWAYFPRGEPVNVLADHTFVTVENNSQAALIRVTQYLDSDAEKQNIRLVEAARHTRVMVSSYTAEGKLIAENPASTSFWVGLGWNIHRDNSLTARLGKAIDVEALISSVLNDETFEGEHKVGTDSDQRTLSVLARRGRDPITGEFVIFLTEEDITEQSHLAEQLAELNAKLEQRVAERSAEVEQRQGWYRALFEHAPDAILIRDLEDMSIVAANPAAAEMFGVDRASMLNGTFDPLKKKFEVDNENGIVEKTLNGGLNRALKNGSETMHATFYRANNQPFPAQVTLIPFPDPERRLVRASIIDLSEREQEQLRYRALFDTAAEAIVINDIDDRNGFVEMNRRAEALFGVTLADFQSGRYNFYDFSPKVQPDGRDSIVTAPIYTQAALRDGSSTFEWTFVDIHGKATPCVMTITPFPHPTKRLIRSSILDISERKAAELTRLELESQLAQAQKLEAVGQLTGGVAHDFNNLLAVIMGNLELLLDQVDTPALVSQINSALEATERGARLTRSMLAFARRSELYPTQLNLAEAIAALDDWVGSTIPDNIELTAESHAELWPVEVDLAGVERCLLNLVINARDAMPNGGKLTIKTDNVEFTEPPAHLQLIPGRYVSISVGDTGCGIAADALSRVFEPFFSTKEMHENSGLGLSMVHGFVTQSGGSVDIDSTPDVGTTIVLYFPAGTTSVSEPAEQPYPSSPISRKLNILLVEDQEPALEVVARILETQGHEVTTAISGSHALKIYNPEAGFDLLITDVDMPGDVQGPGLADALLSHQPELPVIFLSGYNVDLQLDERSQHALRLMKPISRQGLIAAIAQVAS